MLCRGGNAGQCGGAVSVRGGCCSRGGTYICRGDSKERGIGHTGSMVYHKPTWAEGSNPKRLLF